MAPDQRGTGGDVVVVDIHALLPDTRPCIGWVNIEYDNVLYQAQDMC